MRRLFSLRTKLILAFIGLIVIPIASLSLIIYQSSTKSYYETLKSNAIELSTQIKTSIDNYTRIYESAARLLAHNGSIQGAKTNAMHERNTFDLFKAFIKEYPEVKNVYVGYNDGKFLIYPPVPGLPPTFDPRVRPWYTEAQALGKSIWTRPYTDAADGNIVISAASPVYQNGIFEGVVAIDIVISEIGRKANSVTIGENGYIVLLDSEGIPFTHPNSELIGEPIAVDELRLFVESNKEGEIEYVFNGVRRIGILSTIDGLGWKILASVDEREIYSSTRELLTRILIASGILAILAVIIAWLFSSKITSNINKVKDALVKVSEGDLNQNVVLSSSDEIGHLALVVNQMAKNILILIRSVNSASNDILESSNVLVSLSDSASHAAKEVSLAGEEVASGATRQALDSEESLRNAEKMGSNIVTLTENIMKMISLAQKASKVNIASEEAVGLLKKKNLENLKANDDTEKAVLYLEKQSNQINSFVQIIQTISEQTNLLALNASIEAARAGEHGRGFAVVAEEIRKLAEESSKATDQIKEIVSTIQSGSRDTATIMTTVKESSKEQSDAVEKVQASFGEVFASIKDIQALIDTVHSDLDTLDHSKSEIITNISSIASISEEAAAASQEVSASMLEQTKIVEEVAHSAEKLKTLAGILEKDIRKFKI